MTLRKKTIIYILIIFACLIAITYLVSHNIVLRSFKNLEEDFAARNMKVAIDALNQEISSISSITEDWARWDDSYQFIQDKNSEYIASNMTDSTFSNLKLNVVAYLDSSNNVVYEKGYNIRTNTQIVPPSSLQAFYKNSPLVDHKDTQNGLSGIVLLDEGPLLISSRPILTSLGNGPVQGTLIMGRFLSSDSVEHIGKITQLQLSAYRVDDAHIPQDVKPILSDLINKRTILTKSLNDNTLIAYSLLSDIYGKPGIVFRSEMPRSILQQGKDTISYFILVLMLVGVLFCVAISLLLGKTFLYPLSVLIEGVSSIGETGDFSSRIALKSNDELGRLTNSVNLMLEALEIYIGKLRTRTDQLSQARAYLESIFDVVGDGIGVIDMNGFIKSCNQALLDMFGFSEDDLENKSIKTIYSSDWVDLLLQYRTALLERGFLRFEFEAIRKNGSVFPVEICASLLRDQEGKVSFVVFSIRDMTEHKVKELSLKRKTEDQTLLLDNIEIQVWYLTDPETYGAVNKAHAEFLGFTRDQLEGRKILGILNDSKTEKEYIKSNQIVFTQKKQIRYETEISAGTRKNRILSMIKTPKLDDAGNVEYVICSAEDITDRKNAEKEIKYLSFHDSLTGLYNRAFFEQELKRLDTVRQYPLSVIIGDMNGLKITNDVFGHSAGDKLLQSVAKIIRTSCREEDIIARWGGDEFSIILPKTTEEAAMEICERIVRTCSQALADPIQPSIALGAACKKDNSESTDIILKKAENRMYRHKLLEDKSARSSVISLMEKTLNERSFETREHAQRLRHLAVYMGHSIGLSKSELDELTLLASLHDIGKIAIPDAVLNKCSGLTPEEWEIMKKHPEIGYRIAKSCPEFAPVAEAILSHHEFFDGTGYPQGLKGEEIPSNSRIISIVDAYDALTHDRPYRKAASSLEALEEIRRCAGTQFDPKLVITFLEIMESSDTELTAL
ncbi:MAG: diguanylate cyclase [Clostridia bacterium]|nr:diguanylate cyclase [Clostridia bacterium]